MGALSIGGGDGSDGENVAEDAEVRSLSLSEDSPAITKELSERDRNAAAPDPIAMLTHGQRALKTEDEDYEKKNGSSDLSNAGTEAARPMDVAQAESHEYNLCKNLADVKTTGSRGNAALAELVSEGRVSPGASF